MIEFIRKQIGRLYERSISLLVLNLVYVFLWGFTSGKVEQYGYGILFSLIFIFAVRAVKKNNRWLFLFSAVSISVFWLSFFLDMKLIMLSSYILSIIFFSITMVLLVLRLAGAKEITAVEFLEGINLYLLMGITGSLLFSIIYLHVPDAFSSANPLKTPYDLIYFSFVTLTSLGYGDIVPITHGAKSMAIFLSFSGQIYIAMIVSMMVGKYLNSKN